MYLHWRMFCALTHTSSIPMGAINFYMQECFFTLTDTTSISMFVMYLHARMFCTLAHKFYSHGCNIRAWNLFWACAAKPVLWLMILLPCTVAHKLYSHVCNVRAWNLFWASVAKPFFWQLMILLPCTLTHRSSIPMGAMYLYIQECFLHSIQSH